MSQRQPPGNAGTGATVKPAPAHQAGDATRQDSRTGPSQHLSSGIWASMVTLTGNDAVNSTVGLAIFKVFYFVLKEKKARVPGSLQVL